MVEGAVSAHTCADTTPSSCDQDSWRLCLAKAEPPLGLEKYLWGVRMVIAAGSTSGIRDAGGIRLVA
jgi:hypothetical protein